MSRTARSFQTVLIGAALSLAACSHSGSSPTAGASAAAGTAGASPVSGSGGDGSLVVAGTGAVDAGKVAGDAGTADASSPSSDGGAPSDAGGRDVAADGGGSVATPALVRMLHRIDSSDDAYLAAANGADGAARTWIAGHWSLFEGFGGGPTPAATAWHQGGLLYFDTTAVNTGANPPDEHILKRKGTTQRCYNPWGGNPNPQVTWNITSEATRQYLIAQMKASLTQTAWRGLWLDDVNLDIGSSCVGPNDETWYTEFGSTWPQTWADSVATFMEEIRDAFPDKTLLENAPWFSRSPDRWMDPYVARQLKTASLANREGGVLDNGLTTGSAEWSVKALFDYVDAVHAAGAGVVWDSFPSSLAERKYALAAYFIGYTEKDCYGDMSARTPASWPSLYDLDLGRPMGPRTFDGDATFSRVFEKGTVVLDVRAKTAMIPGF